MLDAGIMTTSGSREVISTGPPEQFAPFSSSVLSSISSIGRTEYLFGGERTDEDSIDLTKELAPILGLGQNPFFQISPPAPPRFFSAPAPPSPICFPV